MRTGVYTITCIPTGAQYVGSAAISFAKRFAQHRHELRRGTHKSTYLQRSWNKYGESAFVFEIVERADPADAVAAEQRWLDRLRPAFNTAKIAGSTLGSKRTPEQLDRQRIICSKINLSKADHGVGHLLKVVQSPEFKQMQSARMKAAQASGFYDDANRRGGLTRSRRHLLRGEKLTVREIAARHDKTVKSIRRRLERGLRGEELIAPSKRGSRPCR